VSPFDHPSVRRLVRLALEEDIGRGDVTTAATVPVAVRGRAAIVARHPLVVAGLPMIDVIRDEAGLRTARVELHVEEGRAVGSDTKVAEIGDDAARLLMIERVTLNFLQRISGVATLSRRYVEAVAGTRAKIVDTRKTVPGWRLLDKYAVAAGGAANHRSGLDDGILIKDNHIVACGSVRAAVERARARGQHLLRVEVECETPAQIAEALDAGADVILLDNMAPHELADAVRRIGGGALVEASGGVTLETVRAIAETGVDLISVGALTHSAPAADLAMDLELVA
jgi:nicotinate-nucleotide pyrophosphorylase (carboxylating)